LHFRIATPIGKVILLAVPLVCGCCTLSTAVFVLIPTPPDPEPTALVAQPAARLEATTEESVPTDLPVSPPATATGRAARTPTSAPSTATATLRPTSRPTSTARPTARPTNTSRPTTVASTATPRPTNTIAPPTATIILPTATFPLPTAALPLPTATQPPASGEIATVTAIIDGDTIEVNLAGAIWRVRYIGIDTPEVGDLCSNEATNANAALVSGQTVRMVRDVSETDRYGRLLRYVYVGDTFVNGALVSGGWAVAVDYPPDTALSGLLHSLAAQAAGVGCALVAPLPTTPPRAPEATVPVGGNCDPSYPTVCIPPPPPDLDCGDIPYRRFTVLPPDPHNFDGSDNDGIGCESG